MEKEKRWKTGPGIDPTQHPGPTVITQEKARLGRARPGRDPTRQVTVKKETGLLIRHAAEKGETERTVEARRKDNVPLRTMRATVNRTGVTRDPRRSREPRHLRLHPAESECKAKVADLNPILRSKPKRIAILLQA